MSEKMTTATPAGVSRSRSRWTRRQRAEIRQNAREVQAQIDTYRDLYGDDDADYDHDYWDEERCYRCGGEGLIEYAEGGPEVWGEDCPSEVNHLVTCPDCGGNG